MNIRNAILAAADHIERNPGCHDFSYPRSAHPGRQRVCALGWIGTFALKGKSHPLGFSYWPVADIAKDVLGISDSVFLERMAEINLRWPFADSAVVGATLRLYADKYHPAAAPYPVREKLGTWAAIAKDVGFVPAGVMHGR